MLCLYCDTYNTGLKSMRSWWWCSAGGSVRRLV